MKLQKGFTLIELLVVVCVVGFVVFYGLFILTFCQGNYWYTEEGVLRELAIDHPEVAKIVKTERNVYADSVITAEQKDGQKVDYCLDTSVLWNYHFSKCSK